MKKKVYLMILTLCIAFAGTACGTKEKAAEETKISEEKTEEKEDTKKSGEGTRLVSVKDIDKYITIGQYKAVSYTHLCENCADILIRPMRLGGERKVDCLMVYLEVTVSNMMLDDSAIGKMINHFWKISPEEIEEFLKHNSLGIADVKKLSDMEEDVYKRQRDTRL